MWTWVDRDRWGVFFFFGGMRSPLKNLIFFTDQHKNMHKKTALTAVFCLAAVAAVVLSAGCVGGDTGAKDGDTVSVFYTLTVDGVEEQSNFGSTPFPFKIGAGETIKGFNDGVIGMKAGETKTIVVSPENGYGVYSKEKKAELPLSELKQAHGTVSVGDIFEVYAGYTKMNAEILSIDEEKGTADAAVNHPLAGKTLIFTVMLDSITPAK